MLESCSNIVITFTLVKAKQATDKNFTKDRVFYYLKDFATRSKSKLAVNVIFWGEYKKIALCVL